MLVLGFWLVASLPAAAKEQTFVIRAGALLQLKPGSDQAFVLGTNGEYRFAGPAWLAYGGRASINSKSFGWNAELGLLLRFEGRFNPYPTFKAAFEFGSFSPIKTDTKATTVYFMGASFGPGLRYYIGDRALCLEAMVELGRFLEEPRPTFFAIVPAIAFEL